MEEGAFTEAERCYRALLYPSHAPAAAIANAALSTQLDDSYFLSGVDFVGGGGSSSIGGGGGSSGVRRRIEEEFAFVLLCVGEAEEALEVSRYVTLVCAAGESCALGES